MLDEKFATLFTAIKEKLDTVLHQQRIILQELGKTRAKSTPHISARFCLPAQSFGMSK
jgi:hypothetical protein